ncbi:hypothetical protein FIBSPDRAFT_277584 [Athelia psychrophila]|nr:hypothetical protein FIBSPDRAFT_277584 [Fibularhizoctonia sp. CBS 109695]
MLLYRTFIVWGRNYVVAVLPVLLFGLDISMSIWFTWSINQATPGANVLASTVFQRAKYFYAATLAMNLCCTLLIGFRIWKIQSGLNSFRGGGRVNVLSIIVESAAIYSVALICLIGTSVGGSSIMFAFLNLMPPLVGCVFAFLTIGSSSEIKKSQAASSSGPGTLPQNSMHRNRERHPQSYMGGNDASFTTSPTNTQGRVVIRLDRVVQVHDDGDSGEQVHYDGDSAGGRKEQASIV